MRVVPAKSGWLWLVRGFALFRKSTPMWLLLVFTYYVAVALLGQIRYLGPAAYIVLTPAFSVSFMVMCAVLDRGGMLRPELLVSGFRSALSTLIILGVVYLLSIVVVFAITSLADAGALLRSVLSGQPPPKETMLDGSFLRALQIAPLAALPVFMAFWFAPVLAAWNRMGAAQSLFYSFFAVWRNWRAFLVYTALVLAATLLAAAVTATATRGETQTLQVLSPILTLLALPTVLASFYASYRDIFPENAVPPEAQSTQEIP